MHRTEVAVMAAIGLALLTVLAVVFTEHAMPRFAPTATRPAGAALPSVSKPELTDFSGISTRGTWKVNVSRGDRWRVELSQADEFQDRIRVRVERNRLVLEAAPDTRSFWERWRSSGPAPKANIVMPELHEMAVHGVGQVRFSGFSGKRLRLAVDGAGTIDGCDGHFDELELAVKGAGNVDLGGVAFTDARLDISGAGDISLHMDGGVLDGRIAGAGDVAYSGSISEERVTVSGVARVHHQQ